jgi:hypothetical protein
MSVVSVVLSGRGLCVKRSLTECVVSEYDLKAPKVSGRRATEKVENSEKCVKLFCQQTG